MHTGVTVGKPEDRFTLPKHNLEDDINIDLKGVDLMVVGWICLAEDSNMWRAVKNAVMNLPLT